MPKRAKTVLVQDLELRLTALKAEVSGVNDDYLRMQADFQAKLAGLRTREQELKTLLVRAKTDDAMTRCRGLVGQVKQRAAELGASVGGTSIDAPRGKCWFEGEHSLNCRALESDREIRYSTPTCKLHHYEEQIEELRDTLESMNNLGPCEAGCYCGEED